MDQGIFREEAAPELVHEWYSRQKPQYMWMDKKNERKMSILTKQKAECIREQHNVKAVLKSGPVILSFGKLSFDSHRLRVNADNWLVVSFVSVIDNWWIGRPGPNIPVSQGLRIGLPIILKEENWEILREVFIPDLIFTHW